MPETDKEERPVYCPKCRNQVGTTPDGKSLKAGKGAVLRGNGANLHLTEGVLALEVEGAPPVIGCQKCGRDFTVKEALQAQGH